MIFNPTIIKKGGGTELPAYMSAKNFTFDGNACTGYTGDNTLPEIIIPRSYSTTTTQETLIGAKILEKDIFVILLQSSLFDTFSAEFSDGGTNTQTYTSTSQLQNLSTDFPNDCYLVSMQGSNPFSFDFLHMASDMQMLQFPIGVNGQSFNDGLTAYEYIQINNITNVNFGGDVEVISYIDGDDYQVTSVSGSNNSSGFKNYQNRIILLSNLTSIGEWAFYGCNSLTSIEIPNSVTSIGENAFAGCTALTSIDIPSSVTNIEEDAFFRCDKLGNITVDPSNANYCSDEYGVLFNKDKTELIQYPIGKSEISYQIPSSVTSIGDSAFYGCISLSEITIPQSVKTIGDDAFSSCYPLVTVTFGENSQLGSVGEYAFSNCPNLTTINIPSSVTSIGRYAFRDCDALETVTFGENSQLGSIGDFTFYGCDGLTNIIIPDSVTSIERYAFSDCFNLTTVRINATIPPTIQSNTFEDTVQRYEVPAESVEAYKTATNWSKYADKIFAIE